MRILIFLCLSALVAASLFSADDEKNTLRAKIGRITIEKIELQNVKLSDAIAVLRDLCKKADPEGKGINISCISPKDDKGKTFDPLIKNEINLANIPLKDLLRYICDETGMNYRIESFSVVIYPKNMATENMETRSYPLAPGTADSIEKDKK